MKKSEKVALITKLLKEHFPNPKPALHFKDPFTLLVSVMLSAQCTDVRVNLVTPALFALADTPKKMADLPLEVIEDKLKSLGLFRTKAKNLKALSKILVDQFGSKVPEDIGALESLPGIGHKTASVVMNQAFGKASFPVDTHIHRVAKRWGLSNGKNVETTEKDLKKLFPKETWGDVHLQMVLFGRHICTARSHDPAKCPICSALKS